MMLYIMDEVTTLIYKNLYTFLFSAKRRNRYVDERERERESRAAMTDIMLWYIYSEPFFFFLLSRDADTDLASQPGAAVPVLRPRRRDASILLTADSD